MKKELNGLINNWTGFLIGKLGYLLHYLFNQIFVIDGFIGFINESIMMSKTINSKTTINNLVFKYLNQIRHYF